MHTTGKLLIGCSFILWLLDRTTHYISTTTGILYCGQRYLKPVNGVVGDVSCGFNMDMYVTLFLMFCMLLGYVFLLAARKKGNT